MESAQAKIDEPFGRQPKPVEVILSGHPFDVEYWKRQLMLRAGYKGDIAQSTGPDRFKIYPRAVND